MKDTVVISVKIRDAIAGRTVGQNVTLSFEQIATTADAQHLQKEMARILEAVEKAALGVISHHDEPTYLCRHQDVGG